jgi:hypothetical protein
MGRLRDAWVTQQYKLRGTPHISLAGVRPDADALYDGEMIAACARFWSSFLDARPILEEDGQLRRIDPFLDEIRRAMEPKNRPLLLAVANATAPFGRLAEAAFALSYAQATSFFVAGGTDPTARPIITPEDIEEAGRPYSWLADDFGYVERPGWWAMYERDYIVWQWAIAALRWAFKDQVQRWETSEGSKMGKGVGFDLPSGELVHNFTDLLFEHGGRFFEAEQRALEEGGRVTNPLGIPPADDS